MKIKKHQIKVLNEENSSDFIIDLKTERLEVQVSALKEKGPSKTQEESRKNEFGGLSFDFEKAKIKEKDKRRAERKRLQALKKNREKIAGIKTKEDRRKIITAIRKEKRRREKLSFEKIFLRKKDFFSEKSKQKLSKTFFFPLYWVFFTFFKIIFFFSVLAYLNLLLLFKPRDFLKKNWNPKDDFSKNLEKNKANLFKKREKREEKRLFLRKKIKLPFRKTPSKKWQVNWSPKRINPPKNKKTFWVFIVIMVLLVFSFKMLSYYRLANDDQVKKRLINYSLSAIEDFSSAIDSFSDLDLYQAQNNFLEAGNNFLLLSEELKKIDEFIILLASLSNQSDLKMASQSKKIAKIGINLSSSGDNLSLALKSLIDSFSEEGGQNNLNNFSFYSKKALNDFKKANRYLEKIKISAIPENYQEAFLKLKNKFNLLEDNFSDFIDLVPLIEDFLGFKNDRRYLFLFQNNAELRATGGFIGSYALVDVKKGKIKKIESPAGGSYDTEGGMKVLIEAPQPLHLIKPLWYFWDANWWPDWKTSAQNLIWFYEKSGGPSVDGLIAITPDLLKDILKITGPIDLTEKYGVVIDEDNFWDLIQEIVEVIGQPELYQEKELRTDILNRLEALAPQEEDDSVLTEGEDGFLRNEPKEIISDLLNEILDFYASNFNQDILLKTVGALESNLNLKNILLYFNNDKIQKEIEKRSWAGRIKDSDLDYLMVVDTNIAGGKTNYSVINDFSLEVQIDSKGEITNKLKIIKKHLGEKGSLFSGVRNVNWLRVYVPQGSTLIRAEGFSQPDPSYFKETEDFYSKHELLEKGENQAIIDDSSGTKIYEEANKTVFANWTMVDPGEAVLIEIEYQLPFNFYELFSGQEKKFLGKTIIEEKKPIYSILWQKQAGAQNSDCRFKFYSDLIYNPSWVYPLEANVSESEVDFELLLDRDRYGVIILE